MVGSAFATTLTVEEIADAIDKAGKGEKREKIKEMLADKKIRVNQAACLKKDVQLGNIDSIKQALTANDEKKAEEELNKKVNKILSLAKKGKKVSGSKDEEFNELATVKQIEVIKATEKASGIKITKNQLTEILNINDDMKLEIWLKNLEETIQLQKEKAKAEKILKLTDGDLWLSTLANDEDFKGLATAKQIEVIKATEKAAGNKITTETLTEILRINGDEELENRLKELEEAAIQHQKEKAKADFDEKIQKILKLTDGDVWLSTLVIDKDFKRLVTAEQFEVIKAKETKTGKKITAEELEKILKADDNATLTEMLKDLIEIDDVGANNQTQSQTQYQSQTQSNSGSNSNNQSDSIFDPISNSNNQSTKMSWYMTKPALIVGSLAVLALCGGAYMMSNKSEETDL